MKSSHRPPSTTSLPQSPHDDAHARSTRYLVLMGVRIVCFILMVVITPYGWHTAILGAAAIFLPYIAVVGANVSENVRTTSSERPERALPPAAEAAPPAPPNVIRITETRPVTGRDDAGSDTQA